MRRYSFVNARRPPALAQTEPVGLPAIVKGPKAPDFRGKTKRQVIAEWLIRASMSRWSG